MTIFTLDEMRPSNLVASCSFGKDSLAMCLLLIERGFDLKEVVYYNTGMEFKAIYAERDRWVPYFEEHGVRFTELQPDRPFMHDMFIKPVVERGTGITHYGYGWCGGACRWGTTFKNAAIARHKRGLGDVTECVGIAADENRPLREGVFYPLVEFGMAEADCLQYCYERGATWDEGGIRLYDVLDRVSCWCCRNKNEAELRAIHDKLPEYWGLLCGMEDRLGTMKAKSLRRLVGECQ